MRMPAAEKNACMSFQTDLSCLRSTDLEINRSYRENPATSFMEKFTRMCCHHSTMIELHDLVDRGLMSDV